MNVRRHPLKGKVQCVYINHINSRGPRCNIHNKVYFPKPSSLKQCMNCQSYKPDPHWIKHRQKIKGI